jgi:hypothetical protein
MRVLRQVSIISLAALRQAWSVGDSETTQAVGRFVPSVSEGSPHTFNLTGVKTSNAHR